MGKSLRSYVNDLSFTEQIVWRFDCVDLKDMIDRLIDSLDTIRLTSSTYVVQVEWSENLF